MIYRKHLNDEFPKNKSIVSKPCLCFISLKRVDLRDESWMFFSKIVEKQILISNTSIVPVKSQSALLNFQFKADKILDHFSIHFSYFSNYTKP